MLKNTKFSMKAEVNSGLHIQLLLLQYLWCHKEDTSHCMYLLEGTYLKTNKSVATTNNSKLTQGQIRLASAVPCAESDCHSYPTGQGVWGVGWGGINEKYNMYPGLAAVFLLLGFMTRSNPCQEETMQTETVLS